jgi:sterol desaturase/sphingolipid hydroxylase (fatty acid hydroxylase superfamily)
MTLEHLQGVASAVNNSASLPLRVLIFIFLFDALSYIWHRASHKFSWLWLWHKLHHQEPVIETTSAFRFHPIEITLSFFPRLALTTLLSATTIELIIFEIVFQISNMLQHSNFTLPKKLDQILAKFIITPSQHRLHHSQNEAQQNKNFSTIFNIWDKLFRTHEQNFKEQIKTMGLNHPQRVTQ